MGVAKPLTWEPQMTTLRADEILENWRPDWHVRRKNGEHAAYICWDTKSNELICTQKLSLLAKHINSTADDKMSRVSETALYYALSNDGHGLNGGCVKYRWRVRPFRLEEAIHEFNNNRPFYKKAMVLGAKQCVQTKVAV
jgi:hypothetical protein